MILKDIVIQPTPIGDLTFVNASFNSIYGMIKSEWTLDPATRLFSHSLTLPINSDATVKIPAVDGIVWEGGVEVGEKEEIEVVRRVGHLCEMKVRSGTYAFTSYLPK